MRTHMRVDTGDRVCGNMRVDVQRRSCEHARERECRRRRFAKKMLKHGALGYGAFGRRRRRFKVLRLCARLRNTSSALHLRRSVLTHMSPFSRGRDGIFSDMTSNALYRLHIGSILASPGACLLHG